MQKKKIRNIIAWSLAALLVIAFIGYKIFFKEPPIIDIQKEVVMKESIFMEVSATGTINPILMVDIGTQVSGEISEVLVDYNDVVKQGQVLARMDVRILKSSLEESEANLSRAKVALKQADRSLKRSRELFSAGVIPKIELEKAEDVFSDAQAAYNISKLQLDKNSVSLGYADIVSPIDGVVISKNIDVGQTIAATFTSPVLFTIAKDLREMKIEASVDEADIGQVKNNQSVTFTVDSYPEDEFKGVVTQVQLQPTVIQNVVTYNVIILIQNPDLKLMPGMTATLIILTDEKPNSITVPNSAMTFNPLNEDWEKLEKEKYVIESLDEKSASSVWILDGKTFKEISVVVGFTNGIKSSVTGNLEVGDSVITNLKIYEKKENENEGNLFSRSNKKEE